MKKLILILTALTLLIFCAAAEETDAMLIGGADEPTMIFLAETTAPSTGSLTLSFDANITTGYAWTAFVVGGDSVMIDEENSGYVSDPNPNLLDGVGGTHYFRLNALKEGESVVRFTYSRGPENAADMMYMLITVENDLRIRAVDITGTGVYDGTVTGISVEDHTVTLDTERLGEVTARFDDNETLPAPDEHITVYTNGTATLSLPAVVNVIGWSAAPSGTARETANKRGFIYSGEGFGSEFRITLYDDGTFTSCEGALSSYIGIGTWTEENGVMVLNDTGMGPDSPIINRFRVDGDQLNWIEAGSDNFIYVRLQDGAVFNRAE